jgi:Flp pilus assembly protein TadG
MGINRQMKRVWRWLGRYRRDRRGNISTLVALLIVPLVGVMGIATETGNWFLMQRSMQNAADSAVLAAATNATGTSAVANQTYVQEGRSVATKFGYTNGANNTTVTVTYPDNTVPSKCANACYAVTITRNVPVYLTRIIGYTGSGGNQAIVAKAVAVPQNVPTSYCLVSLGGGDAFHINGGNSVDLNGCNVLSNGDTTCNGNNSNGGANSITYLGNNKKCSPGIQASTALADPYASLASNIPSNSCDANIPLSGSVDWSSRPVVTICGGDVTLAASATLTTAPGGTVLVIKDGNLNVPNGMTLSTGPNSGLTVIFTGTNAGSHIMTGGGTLDIAAPMAGNGVWSGMAIYQDPALTSGVDMSAAGNSPTWNISGIIYVPHSDLLFSGVVNKANNGLDCFVLVDYTFQSNGTGTILENQSRCGDYGVTLPSISTLVRTTLVY